MGGFKHKVSTTKREGATTNPYGANQWQFDPRQNLCWSYYINPKSETFANGYKSALKAGYEDSYAQVITVEPWFKAKIRRMDMLEDAENTLQEIVKMKAVDDEGKNDVPLLRVKADVSKFLTSTLGKNIGYAQRTEHTGADGETLKLELTDEQRKRIAEYELRTISDTSKSEKTDAILPSG